MAIEFALILPVLVALVLGIIEFGRGYNIKIELTGAVREGARDLALGKSDPVARQTVRNSAVGVPDPALMSFSGVQTCPAGSAGRARITVAYPFTYSVFFFSGSTTINITGDMRCGV